MAPAWSAATRVAFRFCFVYFGRYALATQVEGRATGTEAGYTIVNARRIWDADPNHQTISYSTEPGVSHKRTAAVSVSY
jgi:hypothetical protein